jgi:cation diffusion facilitator CzcD-associated flavoprotein CzcO
VGSDALTAIIGAGPHGLAAAAHLRSAGVRTVSFGQPLEFWQQQMPAGMLLRSRKRSSNIADPQRSLTIADYEHAVGRRPRAPLESLPLEDFVEYGLWFQRQVVPDLDARRVTRVGREDRGFCLRLMDGFELEADRVVVAAGLAPFPNIPVLFTGFPRELVSHACHHNDLHSFRGARVAVVGAGQSALESAALLSESGATVEVLVRGASVRWLPGGGDDPASLPRRRDRVPRPPTDVGGVVAGWLAAAPDAFRRVPRRLQPRLAYRCIRPAGAGSLRPRLGQVQIICERRVTGAEWSNGRVRLALSDGSERIFDHVLLGTGYDVDVRRYPFLAPELAAEVQVSGGYPVLGPGLESSVPRLHFLGAPAAHSFGPIMRFVVGSWYAAPALTRRVLGRPQPLLRFSF